jgi:hypothetical protein
MADLDLETVEQVARWCAEAGRQATPAQIRAALGGLGWDELLAARALLADPPPARPLGPYALADLARGTPADVASERERDGRYPTTHAPPDATPEPARPAAAAPAGRRKGKARLQVIVRKKAPAPATAAPPPPLPLLDELLLPAGRAALERLVRAHGGKRPALLSALAAGHRRPDGAALDDADLERLLEHHGLGRAFARRERDEVLHAVRAAGGVLARAAAKLGYEPAGLAAAAARLGCAADVAAIRAAKRRDLAGRATLSDRARLVLADPERLAELGLLGPFEAELRARLPELLTVLGRSEEPLALALARSLSLPVKGVREVAVRLGLDLGPVSFAEAAAGDRPPPRFRPDAPERPPRAGRSGPRPARPPRARPDQAGSRPPRDRPAGGGPPSARPPRAGPPRSGPGGDRPGRPGPRADRPIRTERPNRNDRPSRMGPRPGGAAGAGPRTGARGGRPPGRGGARPGARPAGPRRPPRKP